MAYTPLATFAAPWTMWGKKWLETDRNTVFEVVDDFERLTAWKSETLKQFYVVIHIQWICPIAKNTVSPARMKQDMN